MLKKTRLMLNMSTSYADMRSNELGMKNNGWNAATTINLQQTLPWEMQWTLGSIMQTKSYTLQGHQSGMSFFYTTMDENAEAIIKPDRKVQMMVHVRLANGMMRANGATFFKPEDTILPTKNPAQ